MQSLKDQREDVVSLFEDRYWKILGQFSEHGFNIERYDKIRDFTQNVAVVPMSAKEGEGLQDLLAVSVGLAESTISRLSISFPPSSLHRSLRQI